MEISHILSCFKKINRISFNKFIETLIFVTNFCQSVQKAAPSQAEEANDSHEAIEKEVDNRACA